MQAQGFDLALKQLRITLEDAASADADAVADELALVQRISTAQQQQQAGGQQPMEAEGGGSSATAGTHSTAAAEQPVLMLGAPPS